MEFITRKDASVRSEDKGAQSLALASRLVHDGYEARAVSSGSRPPQDYLFHIPTTHHFVAVTLGEKTFVVDLNFRFASPCAACLGLLSAECTQAGRFVVEYLSLFSEPHLLASHQVSVRGCKAFQNPLQVDGPRP